MCSLNFHSLIHMCEFVRRWGPLWCYSTFGFENFNGFLKRHCHGTRNVLPQLIQSVRMRQALPLLKDRLDKNENSQTVDFLNRVTGKVDRISDVLGKVTNKNLCVDEIKAVQEAGFSIENHIVPVFPRYRQDDVTYSVASKHNSRNNSICKFYRPVCGKEEWFGSIQKFCLVNGNPIVLVSIFDNTDEEVLAMPQSQHRHSLSEDDYKAAKLFNLFGFKVKKLSLSNKLIAISPTDLVEKCVHIPVKYSPHDIIVTLPNKVEHH